MNAYDNFVLEIEKKLFQQIKPYITYVETQQFHISNGNYVKNENIITYKVAIKKKLVMQCRYFFVIERQWQSLEISREYET